MEMSDLAYICSGGETFDSIAFEVYGDEMYASELMCANPELCGKTVFVGSEILYLPVIDVPEDDDDSDESAAATPAPWKE